MKRLCALGCVLVLGALSGCDGTLDSLGNEPKSLSKLSGPRTHYPDTFQYHDSFKPLNLDASDKIQKAFTQLFVNGNALTEAIYFQQPDGSAVIEDVYHNNEVRTEGMGLAMLITVELGNQPMFDQLWTALKNSRTAQGYFSSYCDAVDDVLDTVCLDPYGMQQIALSLMFANDRWHSTPAMPYASDALALLDALQNQTTLTGSDAGDLVSVFDPATHLVREAPTVGQAGYTRSALEIPAYYELWWQATGNEFWRVAAKQARKHLLAAADSTTGLAPARSYADGVPAQGWFIAQGYRTQLNLAIDALWGTPDSDWGTPDQGRTALADRTLGLFAGQVPQGQPPTYALTFMTDGTVKTRGSAPSQALISVNGALAVASSRTDRNNFVEAVWAQSVPTGDLRYYDGLMYLMSLLVLSGQLRVW